MWVVDDERRNPIDLGSQGQRWRSTLALCVSDIVHTIQTTVFVQSFSNFSCKLWMMRGGTLLIFGHGVKGQGQLWHYVYDLVDTIQTTVFAQSLSNFTCKLSMMRGGTLLIMGHGIKGQGQIWHSVYMTLWSWYRLQFMPNHFQTLHVSCGWWEEETYWFGVTGSKVNVNFGILCIRPCGHNINYSFCPITFKLPMWVVDDERRNFIDLRSQGQRSRSTWALCV